MLVGCWLCVGGVCGVLLCCLVSPCPVCVLYIRCHSSCLLLLLGLVIGGVWLLLLFVVCVCV